MRFSLLAVSVAVATTAAVLSVPAASARPPAGGVTVLPLTAARRGAVQGAELAPRGTGGFALVGVSWDDPGAAPAATVEVRTRSTATGRWSDWRTLATDEEDRPDTDSPEGGGGGGSGSGGRGRGATAPLWVGPSDGVAVRAATGGRPLPAGLRAELVDPGADPAPAAARARAGEGPRPGIVTRSGWGADETLREPDFQYTGPVRVVFVHHTDTTNDYACADAPKIIRAIYQYHVKSNGWRDLGYNFLVDKCGTIYEGRAGGVAQPVLGAHTLGFNTDSAGVAALGTYVSGAVPQAQVDGIAKLAAWKLGLTGRDAAGTTTLVSASDGSRYRKGTTVTFNAVSGHRDAFNTECPGEALYGRLDGIRSWAAHLQGR
ncbi:N-acetylmuramoyl-L-alanine amidase [Kitasatospora kazusensis]|uniref:N-acetylmuramoyl-L-alanine amidase n=1 Tax=Kitasatospora kazusensis TaxID=407974 RepID=A0ABN3AB78_9ACTN